MVIAVERTDWPSSNLPMASQCSPNLRVVLDELRRRWPALTNLGCYARRPIRGSTTAPSTHSWGAALDVGFPPEMNDLIAGEVCPFLVGRSEELHLGAVHDYRRCRIWHAGRSSNPDEACTAWWKAQRASTSTGMGQPWCNHLHLEVTESGWWDEDPVEARWTE